MTFVFYCNYYVTVNPSLVSLYYDNETALVKDHYRYISQSDCLTHCVYQANSFVEDLLRQFILIATKPSTLSTEAAKNNKI